MNRKQRQALVGYAYILPCLLLIVVFHLIPILIIFGLSLTKYNLMQPPEWYGLQNFSRLAMDPYIKDSVQNTILYAVMVVPAQTILALVMAVILARFFRNRFGGFVRNCSFIPVVSSPVLVGTIWLFLLATNGGAVNRLLGVLGIERVNWIGSSTTALPSVAMATVWKNVGYFLVIFYAGIMDIPTSLFEAARVDGASELQQFRYVILPMLRPITFLVATLGTIWSFQVFDMVYVMTNGGPGRATLTLVLSIYNAAFREYKFGYASAIAVVLFVVVMVFSKLQQRLLASSGGEQQ
jgi:multiple sugar transport system permease protein